ncbi:MAG TPA: hypothetical protein VH988_09605 [Thermoanaerobaculia bacterium]|jgi:hypothetical protein|nr:hypothetical protein [Thermoanaerobaculia bacterium]
MATDLFTPILNDRTRSVRFFNGRLLSGEAMTDEQSGQRAARALLAQAVGDGIAQGYGVTEAVRSSRVQSPVVSVTAGVAINRRGEILLLASDTEVNLVRPTHPATAPASLFQACTPPQQGVYVADAGVYLLTVCSIGAANGLASSSGAGGSVGVQTSCNAKYIVDAVQFRLLELPVDDATLLDVARLRNLVAYQCFGVDGLLDFAHDPFGTAGPPHTLLDDLRDTKQLTDCDVPLALLYWTATGGIQFLDLWSVRRRVTRTSMPLHPLLTDQRLATAEAMVQQFREQLDSILKTASPLGTFRAKTSFRWLPPAGIVPVADGTGAAGFAVDTFFSGKTWNRHRTWTNPIYMESGRLEALLRAAAHYPPIDLDDKEMLWLYSVRRITRAPSRTLSRALFGARAAPTYAVFANANLPFYGEPRFDREHWSYANFL